jgi:dolichol-phosphate mannosyltransferase
MNSAATIISVVSPVYEAASLLPELVARIHRALSTITDKYEIILVDDNSPDSSWEVIQQLAELDDKIIGFSLSKNFGQQYALNAGFDHASGEWVVSMDCDLQDEPERIVDLYNEAVKGYDIVFASRVGRQDDYFKKTASVLFNKTIGFLTDTTQDSSVANFVMYNRKVIEAMGKFGDYYKYYPLLNNWVGFRTCRLPIQHAMRLDGKKSSYSFRKRIQLAFTTIIAFSDKPLRLVLKFGILVCTATFLVALYLVFRYLVNGQHVSGWLSVFLSIWLLSGIIIIILGLLGAYIGKIFDTVKCRPTYLIKDRIGKS